MGFQFDNYARCVGKRSSYDWFEWKVFMDEPEEVLNRVCAVEYRLHKTFPNPIRFIEDRENKFALRSAGWGEFAIFITVYLEGGTEENAEYSLDLSKPWPADPS